MTLAEIAAGYHETDKALSSRIKELRALLKSVDNPSEAWQLNRRIYELTTMRREVREIGKLCEHYYEGSFWRGEIVQFNNPKWLVKLDDEFTRKGTRRHFMALNR